MAFARFVDRGHKGHFGLLPDLEMGGKMGICLKTCHLSRICPSMRKMKSKSGLRPLPNRAFQKQAALWYPDTWRTGTWMAAYFQIPYPKLLLITGLSRWQSVRPRKASQTGSRGHKIVFPKRYPRIGRRAACTSNGSAVADPAANVPEGCFMDLTSICTAGMGESRSKHMSQCAT